MRPSERIAFLIFRYLRDELTPDQDRELTEWRDASPENEQFFQEEIDPEKIRSDLAEMYEHKDGIWDQILSQTPEFSGKTVPLRKPHWKYPAAAAILIGLGLSWYFLFHSPPKTEGPAAVAAVKTGAIVPGGNHATLLLADGSVVQLDSAKNGAVGANETIIKKDSGELVYSLNSQNSAGITGMNTLKTPRGGQFMVVLSDGSKIWLNAASELKYPVTFSGAERKVELKGEAYFEVALDKNAAFKVSVNGKPDIEVLGTDFDVMAYPDEPLMTTTLLSGSVKTGSKILKPGQQALAADGPSSIQVLDGVDVSSITAWKNGKTSFKDAGIETIMRAVSRWYDVDISYEGRIPGKRFKGGMPRDASLSDLLSVLAQSGIHFTVEGKKIIVTP